MYEETIYRSSNSWKETLAQYMSSRVMNSDVKTHFNGLEIINVSNELEMTFDVRQNGGNARYVKHFKCA